MKTNINFKRVALSMALCISLIILCFSPMCVTADTAQYNYTNGGCIPSPDEVFFKHYVDLENTAPIQRSTLPACADNSTSPYFPPVGDQGDQGSCVAWATTYYAFSYYANKLHNTPAISNEYWYSPSWTYNFLCEGIDAGLYYEQALNFLENHGAISLNDFAYDDQTISRFPNADLSREALYTRVSDYQSYAIDTLESSYHSQQNTFDAIKRYLSQGDVILVEMFSDGGNNCDSVILPNGINLCYQFRMSSVGHAVTIVGYDDTIEYDVNNDGDIEDAEKGAFKVVNSWGTDHEFSPDGYFWVLYDALNFDSEISNYSESTSRTAAFSMSRFPSANNRFWRIEVSDYTPTLIAKAEIDMGCNRYAETLGVITESESQVGDTIYYYDGPSFPNVSTTMYFDYGTYYSALDNYTAGTKWILDYGEDAIIQAYMIDDKGVCIANFVDETILEYQKSCYLDISLGDINYDGILTSADVQEILLCTMNTNNYSYLQLYLGDVNMDGVVSSADARELSIIIENEAN